MSDERVQTLRMVIDVEVRERAPRTPSRPDSGTTAEEHGYEQALFAMLEADPELYTEFIKVQAIISLESLGLHRMIASLAQILDTHTASMQVLQRLLPRFKASAQTYLGKAIEEGSIMDGSDRLFNRVQVEPVSLQIEYPEPPALENR
jgi:hypothetical protein